MNRSLSWLVPLVVIALLAACAPPAATEAVTEAPTEAAEPGRLILATTTSTQDSGLLDVILPDFEEKANAVVDVIAVGTGQALEMGAAGDADVLLVHARAREDEFVANGDGTERFDVMVNDFVIVGPESDPAGIAGMTSAVDAFKAIAESGSLFVSRGDDSGTHTKEKAIWKEAGIEEPSGDWYISAGQGMGEVLTMSDEQLAYTLSDRATYAARKEEGLGLVILVEGDTILFNPYGVIPVNPEKHPGVHFELATQFVEWITSLETQQMIADFMIGGTQVFVPDSAQWREAHP
jgi:tungstate transport system substrate-binding protein